MNTEELIKETTLENVLLTGRRRDGNTTRLVDNAIRILFEGKICVCLDHYRGGAHYESNKSLFKRVLKRISSEHNHLISSDMIRPGLGKFELFIGERPSNESKSHPAFFMK